MANKKETKTKASEELRDPKSSKDREKQSS